MSSVNLGPQLSKTGLLLDLDASYMRSYSPNVIPNPTDLFAWTSTNQNACTLSRDTSITRQYGSIPLKMSITGNDPYTGTYGSSPWNLAPAANGQTWTFSFYAKASENITGNCYIFGANSSGSYIEAPSTSFTITTSWQRFTFSNTFANASTAYIQARVGGPATGGSGKTIWWDAFQVERASSATNFNPYFLGYTIWKDVSSNNYHSNINNFPPFSSTTPSFFTLNGNNQDFTLPSNFNSGLTSGTWDFWVNCASLPSSGGNQQIYIQDTCVWFGLYNYGGTTAFGSDLNNGSGWFDNNGGFNTGARTTSTISANTWYNITYSWDGINIRIYLNGSLQSTTSTLQASNGRQNVTVLGAGTTPRSIGSRSGSYFNGKISIARSFNRALSPTEVSQNYQAMKSRFGY